MKTVGIITLHRIHNYGSFMQAYGTQIAIERAGYKAEIIDYKYPNKFHKKGVNLKSNFLHLANIILKDIVLLGKNYKINKRYQICFNQYYKLSKIYKNQQSIYSNPPIYDIYLTGSDQIWRYRFTKGDGVFFLDFAPKNSKLIAFSTSFGTCTLKDEYKIKYKNWLNRFEDISVREPSGQKIIKSLINRDVKCTIDPSFILNKDEWINISIPPKIKRKYIFIYGLGGAYIDKLAKDLQKVTGFEIIRTNGNFIDYFNRNIKYILDAGPKEWLGIINNAEFIFAGSFHGTALSINLNKPFVAVLNNNENHNFRQLNILNQTGLMKHVIVIGEDNVNIEQIYKDSKEINWAKVNAIIENKREEAINYLKETLK